MNLRKPDYDLDDVLKRFGVREINFKNLRWLSPEDEEWWDTFGRALDAAQREFEGRRG